MAAEEAGLERLREAYLAQARALRNSPQSGHRGQALEAVTRAAAIRRSADLRDDAIACLALPDARDWAVAATAHASKFLDVVGPLLTNAPPVPRAFAALLAKPANIGLLKVMV